MSDRGTYYDVTCPRCGAGLAEPCKTTGGKTAARSHEAREKAATAARRARRAAKR